MESMFAAVPEDTKCIPQMTMNGGFGKSKVLARACRVLAQETQLFTKRSMSQGKMFVGNVTA